MNYTVNSCDGDENENRDTPQQQIIEMGSTVVKNKRGTIHCLTIIGQIEGHTTLPSNVKTTKYEHVLPLLASVEEKDDVDGLLLLLNTVGGDIEAGLGIAELVAGMTKPTATLVLGGGHSIGVPLAVSGQVTMIVPSASMTIHPVRMSGTVIAAPQSYRYFERLQERITQFVVKNSHISAETLTELMMSTQDMAADVGSVLYGEEAVEYGIIDRLGGLSDALSCLYGMMEKNKKGKQTRNTQRKT